jgi:murein DD-endopeptidase MepM/ murein hydrolase activator NlpD
MANLVPYSKSSIIKPKQSAIIKADKFLNAKTKSTKVNENSVKPKQSKNSSEDIILQIEKKVIKIDKLLKDSFALKMNQQKKSTIKEEQKEFENREKELEKKKPKKEPGINLPTLPKMGFIDWIKNFVFNTILGFLAVRLIKFLPTLLKIYPVIIGAGEFLINVGGNLLNSLVSFVDWGYKAVDATSGFIKSIGGEGLSKVFDNFTGAVDNVLEFAVMAALLSSGGDDESGGLGGKGGKRGYDSQGRRVGKNVQQRYERRFGKDKFVDRFGTKNLKNVAQGARRGAFQQGTRNAFVGLAGKGGAKSILKFVRPLTNKLPIIGGLLNFGLSVALGEDPGRAAFKAIGSTLVGALGAAIGSLAFGVGGIIGGIIGGIGGDALGGALYDMFFNGKKPTQKQGKTNKLAGGGSPIPPTRGGKSSSSTPKRTLKKKKSTRTLTFTPRKIHPGRSSGGEAKVQSVFPNPEKKAWWDPLGVFTGKKQEQQPQQKKPKGKTANPQEFLIKSNDIFGRAKGTAGKMISGFSTYIIKSLLGDVPDDLDYLNLSKGLNSFMREIFEPGTLGFAGGGEVDARQFFEGKDYTKVIAKSVKESGSKEVDTIIRNLRNEMSLRPVGKEEMTQDNIQRGTEGDGGGGDDEGGGGLTSGKWGPLLDLISSVESAGGSYDSRYGGIYPGYSKLTIAQADAVQSANYKKWGSAASGKYQFMNISGQAAYAGLKPTDLFSPENQDKMAIALIEKKRYGKDWLSGKISDPEFAKYLSMEWAGLPRGNDNLSYYHGDGRNKAHTTFDKVLKSLNKVKKGGHTSSELSGNNLNLPSTSQAKSLSRGSITSYFGSKESFRKKGHEGVDIGLNQGTPLSFKMGGRVINSFKTSSGDREAGGGYGSYMDVKFDNGNILRLAHLSKIFPASQFKAGSVVALSGGQPGAPGSGRSGGPHLHLEQHSARLGTDETLKGKLDPVKYGGFGLVQTGGIVPRFHGGPILKTGYFWGHKGEYVIDADSVKLFGDIIPDINFIENKTHLIAEAPSIIEKLKSISGYPYYENSNQEPQYIIIQIPPEIVYVPTGSSGRNVSISGGSIDRNHGMKAILQV